VIIPQFIQPDAGPVTALTAGARISPTALL